MDSDVQPQAEPPLGGPDPMQELLPWVYDQLRRAAQNRMDAERAGHTLTATALVHEVYLKLSKPRDLPWASRAHYYAAAAEAMRQILIDHARSKDRAKRGGARRRVDWDALATLADEDQADAVDFIALDEAICRLEDRDPRVAQVVRFRYFAGLSVAQTALALSVSEKTVKNDWAFAKAWLRRELGGDEE